MGAIFHNWWERVTLFCVGFGACFSLATIFLMSPPDMLRWSLAPGTNDQKVAKVLDPSGTLLELHHQLEISQIRADTCQAGRAEIKDRAPMPPIPQPQCIKNLGGETDVKINIETSKSFVGGRILIAVSGVTEGGCHFAVATEQERADTAGYVTPASQLFIATSVGKYRVVLKKIHWLFPLQWWGCTFDVLRVSDPDNGPAGKTVGPPA